MVEDIWLNGTSNYPKDHPLYSSQNKEFLGKMKDECAGRAIEEVIAICSKMYSVLEGDRKNIRKAKGVKKNVVKKEIRREQYIEALFEKRQFLHGMNIIRSEGHEIYRMHIKTKSHCHRLTQSVG